MADRYWVGGTGNINDTGHWSASSGGAGGASVPTSADNAIFDANSGTGVVTFNVSFSCLDWNSSAALAGLSFGGAGVNFNIYGSYTLGATHGGFPPVPHNFAATTTGKTITLAGKTLTPRFDFLGVGGGWTLLDACNIGASPLTHAAGTLDTNGQTVTCAAFNETSSTARTLTLGASVINCTQWNNTGANLTLNAGTSTINVTSAGANLQWRSTGHTYYDVVLSHNANSSTALTDFTGADIFNNLTIEMTTATTSTVLKVEGDKTINGTLKLLGLDAVNRLILLSSTNSEGIQKTWTVATIDGASDFVDFQDTVIAGAAAPWNVGSSIGNGGNNSGITSFTTPVTRYWAAFGANGNWNATSSWAATLGGASGASVPLCHDDVVIEGDFTGLTRNVVMNQRALCRNLTFGAVGGTGCNIIGSGTLFLFGSWDWGASSAIAMSAAPSISFVGRGTHQWAAPQHMIHPTGFPILAMGSGTLELTTALHGAADGSTHLSLNHTSGTFRTNNHDMTLGLYRNLAAVAPSAIEFGSSVIELWHTTASLEFTNSIVALDAGTSTIVMRGTGGNAPQGAIFSLPVPATPRTFNIIHVRTKYANFPEGFIANEFKVDPDCSVRFNAAKVYDIANWDCNGEFFALPADKHGRFSQGGTFQTPDSAANSITGDIDIRFKIRPSIWFPTTEKVIVCKGSTTIAWNVAMPTAGANALKLNWWDSGGTARTVTFDTFGGGAPYESKECRITLDVNNGSGGHTAILYVWNGSAWVQHGASKNAGAFTTSIRDTADDLAVGGISAGGSPYVGRIDYMELRNGIDGAIVAAFYPNDHSTGSSFVSSSPSGETWTRNFNAAIAKDGQIWLTDLTSTPAATINKTGGGTVAMDGIVLNSITATPANTFFAGRNSVDMGNNSGWTWGAPSAAEGSSFGFTSLVSGDSASPFGGTGLCNAAASNVAALGRMVATTDGACSAAANVGGAGETALNTFDAEGLSEGVATVDGRYLAYPKSRIYQVPAESRLYQVPAP